MSVMTNADLIAMNMRLDANRRKKHPDMIMPKEDQRGAVEREADLHNAINDECRRRGWIYFHGSMACASARIIGEPDYTVLADNGRVFFIECKTRTGKLSLEQNALHMMAAKLGHTVHVVRSMEQFLDLVNTKLL